MRLMRYDRCCVILVLTSAAACGDNSTPTAPMQMPPPASVAGTWAGTWQATQAVGGAYVDTLVMNLTQVGSDVSGMWSTEHGSGAVVGRTTLTSFSGFLTFYFTSLSIRGPAEPCTGTLGVSGTAGGTTLNWTSPEAHAAVPANCTNLPTSITLTMQSR